MARFCPNCGTKRVDDAPFCEQCGHAFLVAGEGGPEPAAEFAASVPTDDPAEPAAEVTQPASEGTSSRASRKKPLFVALAIAGLAALAGGLWWTGLISGFGFGSQSGAPEAQIDTALMPVAFGERCGFVDGQGQMVINPQFEAALFFLADSGLAPVEMGGKWGMIDRTGHFVVNPQFDGLYAIPGTNLFVAQMGGHSGIVSAQGNFVVNPQFDQIWQFDAGGRAVVQTGERFGVIDLHGNYVIPPQFEQIGWYSYGGEIRGLADGLVPARSGGRWGYVDPSGNWAITPQFAEARMFDASGLAAVKVGANTPPPQPGSGAVLMDTETAPGSWGYVDRAGRLVIPPQFANAGEFSGNGLAPVQIGTMWGFIDRTGAFKVNPQFTFVGPFAPTGAGPRAVVSVAGAPTPQGNATWRYGVIDESGAFTVNPQFDMLETFDRNGRAVVGVGNMAGLIDETGRFVVNPIYSQLRLMPGSSTYFYQRPAATSDAGNSEIGWIDRDGRVLTAVRGNMCSTGGD